MPDLHGWIAQQIDDREQLAELISPGGYAPDEWRVEPSRSGRWTQLVAYSRTTDEPHEAAMRDDNQPVALVQTGRNEHLLMAMHDPAAVLRRCEADRRVLARHRLNPDAIWYDAAMCEGCGTEGEMGYAVTENLNDCPELLDLGHAHGLTPEILAGLDWPKEGERPEPGPGFRMPDAIASLYGALYKQAMETTFASISAAENLLVTGDPTVEPRVKVVDAAPPDWPTQYSHLSTLGWLRMDLTPQPTPGERAFAVVEPHLSALALYKPTINPEA